MVWQSQNLTIKMQQNDQHEVQIMLQEVINMINMPTDAYREKIIPTDAYQEETIFTNVYQEEMMSTDAY